MCATSVHLQNRFSVGLTGGIGSGKTTVANMFAARGAAIIDTDLIAHRVTAASGLALKDIQEQFGESFVKPDGAMDRAKMRELVFSEPSAKKRLEAILHPLIRIEAERAAAEAEGIYLVFVVPLLVESPTWKQMIARVLVIDCPEEMQISRVMNRSGLDESQVKAIMAAQASRNTRLEAADDVISNDGSSELLEPQIERLHTFYLLQAKYAIDNG